MSDNNKIKSKPRLFIENFLVYGLGGIISKLIPLIMLPIITRMLPSTEYFGLSDLSNTAVCFGSALAIIGMYDAMYRMFFEKDEESYKKKVCSTTLVFTIGMSILVTVLMIICQDYIAKYIFGDEKYTYLVYITAATTLISATNGIISAPTRMQNKRKVFLVTNTISPLISYTISIPLILMGYYVVALPIAAFVSGASLEIVFWILNKKWFKPSLFDGKMLRQLLAIAIPLFPNFIIYWIFNSSDRVMITNLLDVGQAGIYSVGSKLGSASQLIYTAFAGGWQFYAFSTMKDENQVESNSKIFEYLGVTSFFCSVFVFALSKLVFLIIFPEDYLDGYIVAPYLFMSPLMQMLFQVACNQFIVIKKTWPNMFILLSGAIINVVLNLFLIPMMGIEGASIATLVGYVVSDIVCCIVLCKMKLMIVSKRFIMVTCIMVAYVFVWRFVTISSVLISFVVACAFDIMFLLLYKNEIRMIISKMKKRKNEKK